MQSTEKTWTGERLETFIFNENTIEHLHRYAVAMELTKNKTVLDIACGEGYGTNLLAKEAHHVYGVDISEQTITEAKQKYLKPNLEFKHGSTSSIPLADNSIDVVVSFETIEHHDEHEQMMLEIKRVLKPKGLLILSSPDKRTYTDLSGNINPHHIKELYFDELNSLINIHFKKASYHFQKMIYGSIMYQNVCKVNYQEYSGNYSKIEQVNDTNHTYIISIASDYDIPNLETSVFNSNEINMVRDLNFQLELESTIKKIKSTWSYRIGNNILKPFSYIKGIFNA